MGFFSGISRVFKSVARSLPTIAAAAAGTVYGGPMGAISAAAAANAALGSKRSGNAIFKNALKGAGIGALYTAAAPTIASKFGATANSTWGGMTGLGSPSLLSQLGMANAPNMGGGLGFFGNQLGAAGQPGLFQSGFGFSTPKGALPAAKGSAFGGMLGPLGASTLTSALSQPSQQTIIENQGQPSAEMAEMMSQFPDMMQNMSMVMGRPQMMQDNYMPYTSMYRPQYRGAISSRPIDTAPPSFVSSYSSGRNNYQRPSGRGRGFKDGGKVVKNIGNKVGGYVKSGNSDGQADDISAVIPQGSYVMNATDTSLLGNGSNENGAKKLKELESNFLRSGITKPYDDHAKGLKVMLSNDEYVIRPSVVKALGKGNTDAGAKVLDKARKNLRQHKGVEQILPPRAKKFTAYIDGRGR